MGWGPSAPDMSGANRAAEQQAQISREQWDDYKSLFMPTELEQMRAQIANTDEATRQAREQYEFNAGQSKKYADRYWSMQAPLEDSLINEANTYDTDAERERMAAQAGADVQTSFSSGRQQMMRQLYAQGIDPTSPAAIAAMGTMQSDQTAQAAAAMNKTREAARQLGWTKKLDAASLAKGLPGFSSSSSQVALGWNGQGVNNGAAGLAAATSANSALNQSATSAGGNAQGAGQTYGLVMGAQGKAADQQGQMLGAGIGAAATIGAAFI